MGPIDFDAAPFIPILGLVACRLGGVTPDAFTTDPAAQAAALLQTSAALPIDAITVGWCSRADIGIAVADLLPGRALVGMLSEADPNSARLYCEAGVGAIFLSAPPGTRDITLGQVAGAAAHYDVPVILAEPERADAAVYAAECGLAGAIVSAPAGDEAGIVGGGLPGSGPPPRDGRFFWTFAGETPPDLAPEELTALRALL